MLAAIPGDASRHELAQWLDRLIAGRAPPEIELDLLEAARGRQEPEFPKKLVQYQATRPKNDARSLCIAKFCAVAMPSAA